MTASHPDFVLDGSIPRNRPLVTSIAACYRPREERWRSDARVVASRTLMALRGGFLVVLMLPVAARGQTSRDASFVAITGALLSHVRDSDNTSTSTFGYEIALGIPPLRFGDTLRWVNSFYARQVHRSFAYKGTETGVAGLREPTFRDLAYTPVLIAAPSARWRFILSPSVWLRSVVGAGASFQEQLDIGGAVLAVYDIGELGGWTVSFGAVRPTGGGPPIVPIAGLGYEGPSWLVELRFPIASVLWRPTDGLELGINAIFDLAEYAAGMSHVIDVTNISVAPAAYIQLGSPFWFFVQPGATLVRGYSIANEAGDSLFNGGAGPAVLLRAGLSFRPPRPNAAPPAPGR
ncbi:MAG: hypothetical protein H7Z43_14285 [Clostridia bacterium]|nr:hypothetical protein [Deltaproteobacteria bacterium]